MVRLERKEAASWYTPIHQASTNGPHGWTTSTGGIVSLTTKHHTDVRLITSIVSLIAHLSLVSDVVAATTRNTATPQSSFLSRFGTHCQYISHHSDMLAR
jgi:hypothetical protein